MRFFEVEASDISNLKDDDLRELVGRLCEAEFIQNNLATSCVTWGGAQEAPDGGLDVNVNCPDLLPNPNFVPRSMTGFQVKKNSMNKAACKKEMQEKNGDVKQIIEKIAKNNGAYIIVSGKENCSDKMLDERLKGMQEAVASLHNKENLKLDFYGRDRLATWLRQYPSVSLWVRSKLGKPLSGWRPFGRWAATPRGFADDFLADDYKCVFLENSSSRGELSLIDGIMEVRQKLRQAGNVVRIIGLSGVGKTRFAQALFESSVGDDPLPYSEAIYADLGDDLAPSASELVEYLITTDASAYLVLDNCPPDVHKILQRKESSSDKKLHMLTIEYDISDDKPEETEVIRLESSSEKIISTLIQRRFPRIEWLNADKIAEFSGGNARIAIALANCVKSGETLTNFSDEDLFKKLFYQRRGESDSLLKSAEILSLVYSFNVLPDELNDELEILSCISGVSRRTLRAHHAELLRRQLAQKRGYWRAILPQALANRLARRALENIEISDINSELFKPENLRLFKSCAHRIGYLHDCDEAIELAKSWMAPSAPLHDIFSCDVEHLVCLNYIAPVLPEVILSALEEGAHQ